MSVVHVIFKCVYLSYSNVVLYNKDNKRVDVAHHPKTSLMMTGQYWLDKTKQVKPASEKPSTNVATEFF